MKPTHLVAEGYEMVPDQNHETHEPHVDGDAPAGIMGVSTEWYGCESEHPRLCQVRRQGKNVVGHVRSALKPSGSVSRPSDEVGAFYISVAVYLLLRSNDAGISIPRGALNLHHRSVIARAAVLGLEDVGVRTAGGKNQNESNPRGEEFNKQRRKPTYLCRGQLSYIPSSGGSMEAQEHQRITVRGVKSEYSWRFSRTGDDWVRFCLHPGSLEAFCDQTVRLAAKTPQENPIFAEHLRNLHFRDLEVAKTARRVPIPSGSCLSLDSKSHTE